MGPGGALLSLAVPSPQSQGRRRRREWILRVGWWALEVSTVGEGVGVGQALEGLWAHVCTCVRERKMTNHKQLQSHTAITVCDCDVILCHYLPATGPHLLVWPLTSAAVAHWLSSAGHGWQTFVASLVFLVPWEGASCRTRRRGGEREELRVWSHFEACLDKFLTKKRNSQLSLLPAANPRPDPISLIPSVFAHFHYIAYEKRSNTGSCSQTLPWRRVWERDWVWEWG